MILSVRTIHPPSHTNIYPTSFYSMKLSHAFLGLALATTVISTEIQAQDTLRVHGANAIWAPLNAKITDLESASGAKVSFVPNAAGRGLADLAQGQCDIAMVTGSIEAAAEGANSEKPGVISGLGDFVSEKIGVDPVFFVVNTSNPISKITLDQARDLITGKVTNWKEVGGPDLAVDIVRLGPTNGPHIALEKEVLKGQKVVESAKALKAPKDVSTVVSQLPGAFSYIGSNNMNEKLKVIETDKPFGMEMMLVTKGAASPTQQKFIEASKKVISK